MERWKDKEHRAVGWGACGTNMGFEISSTGVDAPEESLLKYVFSAPRLWSRSGRGDSGPVVTIWGRSRGSCEPPLAPRGLRFGCGLGKGKLNPDGVADVGGEIAVLVWSGLGAAFLCDL